MTERRPSIQFRLDTSSGVAPYRQLVDQVRSAIKAGRLRGGDQLPSVREVVTQITINPNTVHRAYRELEYLGLAEGRLGLGTFVKRHADHLAVKSEQASLDEDLVEWVSKARRAGLQEDDIVELIRRHIDLNDRASQ